MRFSIFGKALILWIGFTSWCYSQPYVINLSETLSQTYDKVDIEAYFNHIYLTTEIHPTYVYYPSQRGLILVNQGKLDAEAARFREVGEKYSNLVRVKEPLDTIELILLCINSTDCLTEKRKIGTIKGFFYGEAICEALYLDCHIADSFGTLSRLLETKRIDSVLTVTVSSPSVACGLETKQVFYKPLDQFAQPVFHFVHKSHAEIVDALERQIRVTRNSEFGRKIFNTWKQRIKDCGKELRKI